MPEEVKITISQDGADETVSALNAVADAQKKVADAPAAKGAIFDPANEQLIAATGAALKDTDDKARALSEGLWLMRIGSRLGGAAMAEFAYTMRLAASVTQTLGSAVGGAVAGIKKIALALLDPVLLGAAAIFLAIAYTIDFFAERSRAAAAAAKELAEKTKQVREEEEKLRAEREKKGVEAGAEIERAIAEAGPPPGAPEETAYDVQQAIQEMVRRGLTKQAATAAASKLIMAREVVTPEAIGEVEAGEVEAQRRRMKLPSELRPEDEVRIYRDLARRSQVSKDRRRRLAERAEAGLLGIKAAEEAGDIEAAAAEVSPAEAEEREARERDRAVREWMSRSRAAALEREAFVRGGERVLGRGTVNVFNGPVYAGEKLIGAGSSPPAMGPP